MSEITTVRTPGLIAAEINNIKEQTKKMVLYNSIEIGRRLIEAKQMLNHGEWGNWLEKTVDYSPRTANNLMQLFNEYGADQISLLGDNLNSQAFANLSYSKALALLGVPSEERENFIEENNVEDMSTRELQKIIKEKEKLQEELKKKDTRINKIKEDNEKIKSKLQEVESKKKEDLLNREVEIENLNIEIKSLQKKLDEASSSEGENEEVESVRNELNEKAEALKVATENIEELKKKLEEKPIEVNSEIPEEVKNELEELRKKLAQEAIKHNDTTIKFKIFFEALGKGFEDLLKVFAETEDVELKEKFKCATLKLISNMGQKL